MRSCSTAPVDLLIPIRGAICHCTKHLNTLSSHVLILCDRVSNVRYTLHYTVTRPRDVPLRTACRDSTADCCLYHLFVHMVSAFFGPVLMKVWDIFIYAKVRFSRRTCALIEGVLPARAACAFSIAFGIRIFTCTPAHLPNTAPVCRLPGDYFRKRL